MSNSQSANGKKRPYSCLQKPGDNESPFKVMAESQADMPRGLSNSKSMGEMRRQATQQGAAGPGQGEAAPAPVTYTCLDDFSSRVEIYKGRHSIVWNSVCKHTRKPIILKGYVKAKMTERNFHQVRREIRLMQQINYDGCVRLLGHFEDEAVMYIVQEMCAKGDLFKKLIRNGGQLDERYVAGQVILPLLLTLEHLHACGIYHRDIKPENIFFMRDGQFKLGDFGLAIDATLERSKSRVGTLDYMSPEVVSLPTADERKKMEQQGRPVTEQPYGEKCDVWACGVLAFELTVGRPPFEVDDEGETRKKIMHENTLKFPGHVSSDCVNFIKTALAKNAGMRPTASEMLHHQWLRPYLTAMAQAAAHQEASLSAQRHAPSLAASSSSALAGSLAVNAAAAASATIGTTSCSSSSSTASAAANNNAAVAASSSSVSGGSVNGAAAASNNGSVGRCSSFTSASLRPASLAPPGLHINVDAPAVPAAAAGGGPGASLLSREEPAHFMLQAHGGSGPGHHHHLHLHGGASPTMPTTPGPYGPPGMSRKPIWEMDAAAAPFTAVRTAGLSGEVPQSPTSPRVNGKPCGTAAMSSGGGNPLLKAALNASLSRLTAATTSPGAASSGGVKSGAGCLSAGHQPGWQYPQQQQPQTAVGQQQHAGSGLGISVNVKQRLKDYFISRNTELAPGGNSGGIGAGSAGCTGSLDCRE